MLLKNLSQNKIVIVSGIVLSRHSAEVVFIIEMCNAFSKKGFDTTLLVPNFRMNTNNLFEYYGVDHPFKIDQIKIHEGFINGSIPGRNFNFAIHAAKQLRKSNGILIYSRSPWAFYFLTVLFHKPCIFEIHQSRFNGSLQTATYRHIIKQGMKHSGSRMICISRNLYDQWIEAGIDASKMISEHDAVNPSKFTGELSRAEARQMIGLPDRGKIVAYTGSLIPGKGVDVLVQTANLLPYLTFLIVGGEKQEIECLKKGMENNNVIFTGQVPPTQVPIYQAAADILVLPNTYGGVIDDVTSPMKLFEYMATKRPIVATDMPSLVEILKNNHNALVCPAGDAVKLAQTLDTLMSDTVLAETLSKNAYCDLTKYTWDARVQRLTDFFSTHHTK